MSVDEPSRAKLALHPNALGHHFIIEMCGCQIDTPYCSEAIKQAMSRAVESSGCTVVASQYHCFEPFGISGVTILSESHAALHSWEEQAYVALDLFFCDIKVDPDVFIDMMSNYFQPTKIIVEYRPRPLQPSIPTTSAEVCHP